MALAPLPVLRRDALHAGLATLGAGGESKALAESYSAALDVLPLSERFVVVDTLAAAGVEVERWRKLALDLRLALGHALDCDLGPDCGRCRHARTLVDAR